MQSVASDAEGRAAQWSTAHARDTCTTDALCTPTADTYSGSCLRKPVPFAVFRLVRDDDPVHDYLPDAFVEDSCLVSAPHALRATSAEQNLNMFVSVFAVGCGVHHSRSLLLDPCDFWYLHLEFESP